MTANAPLPEERPRHWRVSFDQVAEDYDVARPGYPDSLVTDIVTLAALPSPAAILEVGCGTGQATQPFAMRGDRLTCLDIGPALLAIARRKLHGHPNVVFQQAAFEEWPAPSAAFDLVLSATAFHWIPPELSYPKAAATLKPSGSLALLSHEHQGFTPGFAEDLYEIDRSLVPTWPDPRAIPDLEAMIAAGRATIDASGLFGPVTVRTHRWAATYSTTSYLRLLNTYSNYRSLSSATRNGLFTAIADLIERRYAGSITKSYVALLFLAGRRR